MGFTPKNNNNTDNKPIESSVDPNDIFSVDSSLDSAPTQIQPSATIGQTQQQNVRMPSPTPGISYGNEKEAEKIKNMFGVPSLFNRTALFVYPNSSDKNGFKRFYDVAGEEKAFSNKVPSTAEIVDKLANDNSRALRFADFAYSKHHKFIQNNRLIVLRRFPIATYNNLVFPFGEQIKPLSQAITYFGGETGNELSDILKYVGYKNYKELTAELNIVPGQGQEKSAGDGIFGVGGGNKSLTKGLKGFSVLSGRGDVSAKQSVAVSQLAGKNWENERKGKENVIHKTNIADVGVGANIDFTLIFEYSLRSFNGVNPRIAMLDLISNLMTLVHTNAEFWGGQNVVLPNPQKFPFIGDKESFYRGDYSKYLGSVYDWFSEPFSSGGGLDGLMEGIMSGDFSSLGSLLKTAGSKVLDLQSSKSRSGVTGLKALLDASPIGNYHVTIGNPLEPIAQIGNIICPSFELTFGDDLGHGGFPTSVKLSASLKTATPLDSTGIQGTFSNGILSNRMYMKPADFVDVVTSIKHGNEEFSSDDIDRSNGVIF